jgi:ribosomal protein S3
MQYGVLPLQTIDSSISYAFVPVNTTYGTFGVKVWISHSENILTKKKKQVISTTQV